MIGQNFKIADLDNVQLLQLKEFEEKTGTCIVAFKPEYELAELDKEKLQKLKVMESELGITIVAYKNDK